MTGEYVHFYTSFIYDYFASPRPMAVQYSALGCWCFIFSWLLIRKKQKLLTCFQVGCEAHAITITPNVDLTDYLVHSSMLESYKL